MTEEKFRLPVSSYGELAKVIQAYGLSNKPMSVNEVIQLGGGGRTTISGSNGFLLALGIIEGKTTKSITQTGKLLANALHHDVKEDISEYWRLVVERNDFFQKIVAAVRIRKGMDTNNLQTHIAYTAGLKKSKETITGSLTVIQILMEADLLLERDGKIVVNDANRANNKDDEQIGDVKQLQQSDENADVSADNSYGPTPKGMAQEYIQIPDISTNININIELRCTTDELDDLGEKLNHLLAQLHSDVRVTPQHQ